MEKNNRVDEFIKKPKKALFTLAWPIVIGMLVQILYNIVDTAFVGRLGAEAIAALTFSFPLFILLMALNSGIGTGMGSRISRFLGEKNKREAENTALHGVFMSLILAIVIFVIGYFSLEALFSLFGAGETVLPLAISYMSIVLIGVFFMFPSFLMHSFFTAQGDTKTPVMVQVIALVINIILDPIFIYVLEFGVQGAAIASVIAFMSALILNIYFVKKRSYLTLNMASFKFSWKRVQEIVHVGAPASLMMVLMSVYIMFINRFMAHFGTDYVAAFGIASRLESVAVMPIMAFSLSLLTLVGMFYGARKYHAMKFIIIYELKIVALITSLIALAFFVWPKLFLRIFTADPTLLTIGAQYMRIEVLTFPLMAVGMSISRAMQAMGYGLPGLIINLTRIVFVAVPLGYIFVFVLNLGFLWIPVAMVMGGIAANMIAIPWLISTLKKCKKKC